MANWTVLKAAIADIIKTNGNQEITGAVLQNTLNSIVNLVGENATFAGVATPSTNPGSPDGPVFYFANNAGVYSNFDGIELENPGIVVLYNNTNGVWKSFKVYECLQELGDSTQFPVSQAVTTEVDRLYSILTQSMLSILNNTATLSPSGIYYSTSKNQVVYSNSEYNSYVLRVEEGKTYVIKNISAFGGIVYIFKDYPSVGITQDDVSSIAFHSEITIPEDIRYILINVQTDVINEAARIYPKDSLVHSSDVIKYFNGTYGKTPQRDELRETGIYINSSGSNFNPAILFVREEDNNSGKIWQMEISTVNVGSPFIRIRQDTDGQSGWSEWKTISIDDLANRWVAGIVTIDLLNDTIDLLNDTIDLLNETDRLYFHRFLLKQGWLGSGGVISQTQWENCYSFLLGVREGDVVGYTNGYQYAFLTDNIEFVNNSKAPLVEGTDRIQAANEDNIVIPATCKYLWISGHFQAADTQNVDYLPDTITINGITYNIKYGKDATIPNLVDRITALEQQNNTDYPKGVLKYTADNKTFQFFMYKGVSNLYFSVTMQLKTDNSDEVYLNEYRWVDGGLYSYSDGTFSRIAGTVSYMENEMAMKFLNTTDYTGGVHGDERIDVEESSFAKFFADGKLLSDIDLSEDFEKVCSEFSYIQYSTLHETEGISDKEATSHPIIAHHLKHNVFKDCASFLDNTVKFDVDDYDYSNLVVDQYHAIIMCVDKGGAATTLLPDFIIVDTSAGTNASTSANNPNNAAVIQWNEENGIKVITEGHFTEGLSDDMKNNPSGTSVYSVWDRPQDSKIYRRYHNLNKQVTKGYVIRNHQEVHFS